jgi:hypothetical protein
LKELHLNYKVYKSSLSANMLKSICTCFAKFPVRLHYATKNPISNSAKFDFKF